MQAERVLLGIPNRIPGQSRCFSGTYMSLMRTTLTERQQIVDLFPMDESAAVLALGDNDEVHDTWRGYHSRAQPNLPLDSPAETTPRRPRSRSGSVDSTMRRTRRVAFEPGRAYKVYDWRQVITSTSPSGGLPRDLALIVDVVAEVTGHGRIDVLKELYALEMLLQYANRQIRAREKKSRKAEGGRASTAASAASTTDGGSVG